MYLINEIIGGNIFRKVIYYFCRSTEVINMTNIKLLTTALILVLYKVKTKTCMKS